MAKPEPVSAGSPAVAGQQIYDQRLKDKKLTIDYPNHVVLIEKGQKKAA
jgi:hypothetical protein